jgi:GLPGLI family protein
MMALDFDKNGSRYYSETAVIQNEEMKKKVQEAEKESDGTGVYKINIGVVKKVTNQELLLYPKNKKFFIINNYKGKNYEIVHAVPDFKWVIKKQTKVIKGYNCQLAIGYWKGRTYNAWFTTDLPYTFGPWKLNGLPGLILEAADATNTVRFDCENINKEATVSIVVPENAILTSQNDFNRMEQSMKKVNNTLQSTASGTTTTMTMISAPGKEVKNSKAFDLNNPLELRDH